MTSNSRTPSTTTSGQPARTDDLLASDADSAGGARGFGVNANPEALQTGMEGIAGATVPGNLQSDSRSGSPDNQTVQDNPGQVRNKQGG
jgi:hypothetical protein